MNGIDTNILLRYVLEDDRVQTPLASRFLDDEISAQAPAGVNGIVLAELVWTLRGRERFTKEHILELLDWLAGSEKIVLIERDAIEDAIELWRRSPCDFADCLIAEFNRRAGAGTTYTFDGDAAETPGFSTLA